MKEKKKLKNCTIFFHFFLPSTTKYLISIFPPFYYQVFLLLVSPSLSILDFCLFYTYFILLKWRYNAMLSVARTRVNSAPSKSRNLKWCWTTINAVLQGNKIKFQIRFLAVLKNLNWHLKFEFSFKKLTNLFQNNFLN